MKDVFKVIGGVHVILAFLVLLLLLLKLVERRLLRVLVLGLLNWISVYSRTHDPKQYTTISIQANTNQKLRNSTSIHRNSTLN